MFGSRHRLPRLAACPALAGVLAAAALAGCSDERVTHQATGTRTAASTSTEGADLVREQTEAAQQCVDAWHGSENDPARASFFLASGGQRGLRHVSVAFAQGDACLISFAGTNGFLVQVIEVDAPSGKFTGLWPPAQLEDFDPSPVGWNASANVHGYVTLRRVGVASPPPTERSDETAAFPNDDEDVVLDATPSDGWQCQRSDEQTQGAVVGVVCEPTSRIRVRYELFPTAAALDQAYWGYFKTTAQRKVAPGNSCVRSAFGEGAIGQEGQEPIGRLFCFDEAKRPPALVWTNDSSRILAFASGRRRGELARWWRSGGGSLG